jgi:hypothetical protein
MKALTGLLMIEIGLALELTATNSKSAMRLEKQLIKNTNLERSVLKKAELYCLN